MVYNEENKNKWTKDGSHWYFRVYYKDINGVNKQYKSKMYQTKKEATKAEAIFKLRNKQNSKKNFDVIATDFFNELSKTRKQSTVYTYIKDYNAHICPYFCDYDINSINIPEIRKWAEIVQKRGLSIAYLNKIQNIFKLIFDYAIKNYGVESNPVDTFGRFEEKHDKVIKDEEKLRYITKEEFDKFISVIDDDMWKTFFMFAFYTGCRVGEMKALTWNDIDFSKNVISINKTLYEDVKNTYTITSTKNNRNRKIQIPQLLKEQLFEYKKRVMQYIDYSPDWFVFGNSRYLPKTTINRYKDKYFDLSGVHRITMHEFRHSHVSLLINEYIKSGQTDTAKFFVMMSDRMGHTIDVMQRTYMHFFPTMQDEIVNLLDNL